jgi:hypothetical protein
MPCHFSKTFFFFRPSFLEWSSYPHSLTRMHALQIRDLYGNWYEYFAKCIQKYGSVRFCLPILQPSKGSNADRRTITCQRLEQIL